MARPAARPRAARAEEQTACQRQGIGNHAEGRLRRSRDGRKMNERSEARRRQGENSQFARREITALLAALAAIQLAHRARCRRRRSSRSSRRWPSFRGGFPSSWRRTPSCARSPVSWLRASRRATSPEALGVGRLPWWTFVTYALLHANWTHLAVNGVTLAAFGSPLARRFGAARFLAFLALTAVAGAAAHFAIHPFDLGPVVGASAAISGTMAASARFAFARDAEFGAPAASRRASSLAELWSNRRALAFVGALVRGQSDLRPVSRGGGRRRSRSPGRRMSGDSRPACCCSARSTAAAKEAVKRIDSSERGGISK